jgi:hypothetical protein
MRAFTKWSVRPVLLAVTVWLSAGAAWANTVVIMNQSNSVVYLATHKFQHANQTHSGYDSWVTEGWWAVAPGKAIQLYSGESGKFWLRASTGAGMGTPLYWSGVPQGNLYVDLPAAFRLEAGVSSFFPAFDVLPGTAHWVYKSTDLTAHGWTNLTGFNYLNSTGIFYISGPRTIYNKTIPFSFLANWNRSASLYETFQPPAGSSVVYYTESNSSRGLQWVDWSAPFGSHSGAVLDGSIAGSGKIYDQWRGSYAGSVTLYYSYP